jgi:hypothetical protein
MDDQVALLLEYLAAHKCRRCSFGVGVDEDFDDDGAATTTNATPRRRRAYHECLVKLVTNGAGNNDGTDPNNTDASAVRCLQAILEALVLDSYDQASAVDLYSRSATTKPRHYLDEKHVWKALEALGLQASLCQESGNVKANNLSLSALRQWRTLLEIHVARQVLIRTETARSIFPWRRNNRWSQVQMSASAVALFRRVVASLLDPATVSVWTVHDGVQISWRSSCGAFKASYYHFIESSNEKDADRKGGSGHNENSDEWIGAVIDWTADVGVKDSQVTGQDDDSSSLGSDPSSWCGDDEEEEESFSDDNDEERAGFSKRSGSNHEMSTASMSSSLSTNTSSDESTVATGPSTPLLGRKSRRRRGPTKEEEAGPAERRRVRLTMREVLLGSGLVRS